MPQTSPRRAVRVVVLSKPHPLTFHLLGRLAERQVLAGVLFEDRFRSTGDRLRYLRRNARREGWWHTASVLGFEVFDRLTRRSMLQDSVARVLPPTLPLPDSVPIEVVRNLNSPEAIAHIRQWEPDLLVVHATGILKATTYGLAGTAALNIHCGVLPEYRGHASTFHALSRGDTGNLGVTVHHVAPTVDTGRAIAVARVPFESTDDETTIWCKAFAAGTDVVLRQVDRLAAGEPLDEEPYEGTFGPHYRRRALGEHLLFSAITLPRLRREALAGRSASARPRDSSR